MNVDRPVHTIRELIRDTTARDTAIRQYALRHDEISEAEQMFALVEEHWRAAEYHDYALILLRAYRAEWNDPEPMS